MFTGDPEEWKARVDLAAIHRLCNNNSWNEGIQNHLTAAVPGHKDQFLIIAFGLLWSQARFQTQLHSTSETLLTQDNSLMQICCLVGYCQQPSDRGF